MISWSKVQFRRFGYFGVSTLPIQTKMCSWPSEWISGTFTSLDTWPALPAPVSFVFIVCVCTVVCTASSKKRTQEEVRHKPKSSQASYCSAPFGPILCFFTVRQQACDFNLSVQFHVSSVYWLFWTLCYASNIMKELVTKMNANLAEVLLYLLQSISNIFAMFLVHHLPRQLHSTTKTSLLIRFPSCLYYINCWLPKLNSWWAVKLSWQVMPPGEWWMPIN